MPSLRDKLNGYSAKSKPSPARMQETRCYIRFDRTERGDYALPDVLESGMLTELTGQILPDIPLEQLLFLDTETTGLSGGAGTVAFLVGMGYFENGQFLVQQCLMRDYAQEGDLLEEVLLRLQKAAALVTFNGRVFDLPLLESRLTMNRMKDRYTPLPHIDLLPLARSIWRLRLRKCSLSALEENVFGMKRQDDLPGALVPQTFFEFLKTKDMALIEPVLCHNCQDIKSLPDLMARLMSGFAAPDLLPHPQDTFSVGRVMEKRGNTEKAHRCYRAADRGGMSQLARLTLADSLRRQKRFAEAAALYEKMVSAGQGGALPCIALAKLYEHRFSDPERALEWTRKALARANPADTKIMQDTQKRALRLLNKIDRKG